MLEAKDVVQWGELHRSGGIKARKEERELVRRIDREEHLAPVCDALWFGRRSKEGADAPDEGVTEQNGGVEEGIGELSVGRIVVQDSGHAVVQCTSAEEGGTNTHEAR